MLAIAKKYGVELGEIYFIDDQLSYLKGTDALELTFFSQMGLLFGKSERGSEKGKDYCS